MKEVTVEEALQLNPVYIDLRSPEEYREDHLPGAVSLPLFTDEERALVGTVYRQEGSDRAKEIGLEFVSPKLPGLVKKVRDAGKGRPVVIYCWRGGLRSKALAQVLDLMNVPVYRLQGGYKAFRRYVHHYFSQKLPYKMVVMHGFTGTGKTEIIHQLQLLGAPAVDLEGLANNRGSVFGKVGLGEQPTQKRFETLLFSEIRRIPPGSFIIVEGESKRIGRNYIPDTFFQAMNEGVKVLVHDDFNHRVSRIIDEYCDDTKENQQALIKSIAFLEKRLGKARIKQLTGLVIAGNYREVVEYLLDSYYDPLYTYPEHRSDAFRFSVSGENPGKAARELQQFLSSL